MLAYNAWIHEPRRKRQIMDFPLVERLRWSNYSFRTRSGYYSHSRKRRFRYCIPHWKYYIRHCYNHRFLMGCMLVADMLEPVVDIHLKNSSYPVEHIGFLVYSHLTQLDLIPQECKVMQNLPSIRISSSILNKLVKKASSGTRYLVHAHIPISTHRQLWYLHELRKVTEKGRDKGSRRF
jgi:hypothetical protein